MIWMRDCLNSLDSSSQVIWREVFTPILTGSLYIGEGGDEPTRTGENLCKRL